MYSFLGYYLWMDSLLNLYFGFNFFKPSQEVFFRFYSVNYLSNYSLYKLAFAIRYALLSLAFYSKTLVKALSNFNSLSNVLITSSFS